MEVVVNDVIYLDKLVVFHGWRVIARAGGLAEETGKMVERKKRKKN